MTEPLTEKQLSAINAMPAEQRYDHFIDTAVASECIWGLFSSDGWVIISGDEDEEYLPVWSVEALAAVWATGANSDSQPTPIELDDWLGEWLPGMVKNGLLIAVSPTNDGDSITLGAEELLADLQNALEK